MASIFVPSVATLRGRFIWWPGHQPGRHLRDKAKPLVEDALHPSGSTTSRQLRNLRKLGDQQMSERVAEPRLCHA